MTRRALPWGFLFLVWCGVLWHLSSQVPQFPEALRFTTSDKILHFGWFFGGAILFQAWLWTAGMPREIRRRGIVTLIVLGLIGVIDEFHQSHVPGRHGNDPFDLAADILGTLAAIWVFPRGIGKLRGKS